MPAPEAAARRNIDAALQSAGWHVQDFAELNLSAGLGVAVREFPLARGHGKADYALYVAGKLAGVVEAKKEGTLLIGVEVESEKYASGVPSGIPAHVRPLPFLYESTGVETQFTNRLDPESRRRRLFHFHKPETLAEWLDPEQNPPPLLPLENGKPAPRRRRREETFAELLSRTFDFDVFACVRCGGRRRVLAYVNKAGGVRTILEHLGLPTAGVRLAPARGPPQAAWC